MGTLQDPHETHPLEFNATSYLRIVRVESPRTSVADHVVSYTCPRFVPSKLGHELLFVAERTPSLVSTYTKHSTTARTAEGVKGPARRLALAAIPDSAPTVLTESGEDEVSRDEA